MWYKGQKAVCVDAKGSDGELVENKIYTIYEVLTCLGCKAISLYIRPIDTICNSRCLSCGYTCKTLADDSWRASRFIPLNQYTALEQQTQESLATKEKIV